MIDKIKIEDKTIDLISKYVKKGSPAKSFIKIITAEKIKFREIDGNDNFLGALVKYPTDVFYIYLNKSIQNEGRKYFTFAHELGHYFLQHYLQIASFYCGEKEIKEDSEVTSVQEREANYFASYFLLPKEKLIKQFAQLFEWYIGKNANICLTVYPKGNSYKNWKIISSKLMKYFLVSETALRIRMVNLGLLEWNCI